MNIIEFQSFPLEKMWFDLITLLSHLHAVLRLALKSLTVVYWTGNIMMKLTCQVLPELLLKNLVCPKY